MSVLAPPKLDGAHIVPTHKAKKGGKNAALIARFSVVGVSASTRSHR
jgi:hypothetical protein